MKTDQTRDRFLVSLGFALVISLATVPWMMLTAPVISAAGSLAWLAIPGLAIYIIAIAPRPTRGLTVAVVASSVLLLVTLMTSENTLRLLAAALALGLARSGWLYRRSAGRALVLELGLLLGGLGLASLLAGGSLLTWALAVWGFLMTQSLFFLVSDLRDRKDTAPGDPFEQARAAALRLLETRP